MPILRWHLVSSFFNQFWHYKSLIIGPLLAVIGLQLGWFTAVDRLYYDYLIKKQTLPAADNFVVITIDDASLLQLGAWPWPRAIHAELITQLERAEPRAIAFDVLFSEPTQALDDDLFAQAVAASEKTFLPIYISTLAYQQQLVERLPLPELSNGAAGLGHIHYVIDDDGISRSVFLHEGLNQAFWPHLSLAIKQFIDPDFKAAGIRAESQSKKLPIQRDHLNLLPFLPAEEIPTLSYIEVLAGQVPVSVFKDKVIFVGASAPGLGDFVITPTSGQEKRLPGVMFNASVFHALDKDLFIEPLPARQVLWLSLSLSLLTLLLGIWSAGIPLLLNCLVTAALLLAASAYLLLFRHLWLPPFAGVCAGLIAYPVWSLIKTGQALRFLQQELERLEVSTPELASYTLLDLQQVLNALQQQGLLLSWQLGSAAELSRDADVMQASNSYWYKLHLEGSLQTLMWQSDLAGDVIKPYIEELLSRFDRPKINSHYSWEIIAATIAKIKSANKTAQSFYEFAQQSLAKLHTPLIIAERSGRILFVNDAGQKLFSQQFPFVQELINQDVDFLHIDNAHFLQQLFIHAQSQEQELQTQDGQSFILTADLDSFDQVGDVAVFIFANITRLRALEQNRSEALHLLSHDLRSPLVSALSVMEKSADADLVWCGDVKRHVRRSLSYAEDFLNLAKAESLEQEQFYECDFYALVDQAIAQLMPQVKAKQQSLVFNYEDNDFWVLGNADLLERMIANLLSNATKYSHANTQISLDLKLSNNNLELCLSDQGIGMDEQGLQQLFQSFYRGDTQAVNKQGGIGLGMRLVATVIERHQGKIEVESELGQGTRFTVSLPALELE